MTDSVKIVIAVLAALCLVKWLFFDGGEDDLEREIREDEMIAHARRERTEK